MTPRRLLSLLALVGAAGAATACGDTFEVSPEAGAPFGVIPEAGAPDASDARQPVGAAGDAGAAPDGATTYDAQTTDAAAGADVSTADAAPADAAPVCTPLTHVSAGGTGVCSSYTADLPGNYYLDIQGCVGRATPAECQCQETYNCACLEAHNACVSRAWGTCAQALGHTITVTCQ